MPFKQAIMNNPNLAITQKQQICDNIDIAARKQAGLWN